MCVQLINAHFCGTHCFFISLLMDIQVDSTLDITKMSQ